MHDILKRAGACACELYSGRLDVVHILVYDIPCQKINSGRFQIKAASGYDTGAFGYRISQDSLAPNPKSAGSIEHPFVGRPVSRDESTGYSKG